MLPISVVDEPVVEEKGNTIKCDVNNWGNGGSVNAMITNESANATDGWKVKIKKGNFTIDSFWCASMEEDGDYYIFTPLDWNKTIRPGETTNFGFNISGNIGDSLEYILE